jgi:hypothetical protein
VYAVLGTLSVCTVESQFWMKKLQPTKILCDACEADGQGGKCHQL